VVVVSKPASNTGFRQANRLGSMPPMKWRLIADGSFERLVPEKYVGEGSFKFAPQLHMGELDGITKIDNQ